MENKNYNCTSQQRILSLVETLAGNEIDGLSVTEISKRMNCSTSAAFRDLNNLESAGWAECLQDNKWRLTVKTAHLLRKVTDNINTMLKKVNQVHNAFLHD